MEQEQQQQQLQPEHSHSLNSLEQDIDRVRKKARQSKKQIGDTIEKLIQLLETTKNEAKTEGQSDQKTMSNEQETLRQSLQKLHGELIVLKPLKKIFNTHREYFAYISKLGKNLEKQFKKEQPNILDEYELNTDLLNQVISDHLLRDGQEEASKMLFSQQEQKAEIINQQLKLYSQMNEISSEIRKKNLSNAIQWAQQNAQRLQISGSQLYFHLIKMSYIQILLEKGREEAIDFSKKYFLQFCVTHQCEIQRLMTCILYLQNYQNSPYKDLFDEINWENLAEQFISDYCKINELSVSSVLQTCISAGTMALPVFMKYSAVNNNNQDWKKKNEFPIDIELDSSFKYHSIFVCPILKEVTYDPPVLFKCGHVVSSNSLKKMTQEFSKFKFKCPICNTPLKSEQVQEIKYQ